MKLLAVAVVAAASLVGCGNQGGVPPGAIAVVGGRPVSQQAFAAELDQTRRSYAAAGRRFPAEGTPAYERVKLIVVRLLVDRAKLEIEAERLGIRITPAQVERRLQEFKQETVGGSERLYRQRLREQRTTDAEVRAGIRFLLLSEELRLQGAAVPKPMTVRYAPGFAPPDAG